MTLAINLTKQTRIGNETMTAFYMAVHDCGREEAAGALRFLTQANLDAASAGSAQISMYAFDQALKLDGEGMEDLQKQITGLTKKISELKTRRGLTDPVEGTITELQKELDQLKGKQFLANYKACFGAGNTGFGLRNGETFSEWFGRADGQDILKLISNMDISDGLKAELASMRMDSGDVLAKLENLKRSYGGNVNDAQLLNAISAGKISRKYRVGAGGILNVIRKGIQKNLLKVISGQSDAGHALGEVGTIIFTTYGAYRAGMKLFLRSLRQIGAVHLDAAGGLITAFGKSVEQEMLLNPARAMRNKAAKKAGEMAGRALERAGMRKSLVQTRRAIVQHASSALKFLTKPVTEPVKKLIVKLGVDKLVAVAGAKLATFSAAVASALGWILVVMIGLALLGEFAQSTQKANQDTVPRGINNDNEIIQEVIAELTQKNNQFMSDINNAANHRGEYNTTTGLVTDENVSFYESYNIVFRDGETGMELEASHVDLNNTKAILAMASRVMPYPLEKPGENASDQAKKDYEDMAQHFKDYCYFLWASTHQISIEEYHPGNSDGVNGAIDNSGMVTTKEEGKCDKDGTTLWLKSDFTKDVVHYEGEEWICDSCSDVPETGMGVHLDDLCSHGKDGDAHGGWRMTGNTREVYNCKSDHNHYGCDDDQCYTYTCKELGYSTHKHTEYEWVYDCGGHMGAVVYVTIGDLSRDPSFPAAKDVDYDAVGKYNTGESINGEDVTESVAADSTQAQQ